ncbi:BTB/POZ fold [Penicillium camemberti]|uniref:BTB/POZ fold n=1 Tax=Penicillium camemberti (strain FM 013) TaxID=1429867 RepID=A0A0G4PH53_PENC3|nr:BTB/POZ fold [Penicillium camemberti]
MAPNYGNSENNVTKIQGPTVKITLGASKEPFHVHESVLCASSQFFKAAMSGSWKESKERTIELPEDDPKAFSIYSHWLYFAEIPGILEAAKKGESAKKSAQKYYDLVSAYVLGDKLLDAKFQNSVIDAIVETCSKADSKDGKVYFPDANAVSHAYNNTTKSSNIRKMLVALYLNAAGAEWLSEEHPKEFLFSVAEGFAKTRRLRSVKSFIKSWYYVRSETVRRSLKRNFSELERPEYAPGP